MANNKQQMENARIVDIIDIAEQKRAEDRTTLGWYGKVTGKVTKKKVRDVQRRDGTAADVHELQLDDGTGVIWITLWDPETNFKEGETVEVRGAYTKYDDYRSAFQLALSRKNSGIRKVDPIDDAPPVAAAPKKKVEKVVEETGDLTALIDRIAALERVVKGVEDTMIELHALVMKQLKILIDGPPPGE